MSDLFTQMGLASRVVIKDQASAGGGTTAEGGGGSDLGSNLLETSSGDCTADSTFG